jgi:hypothetical protein
MVLVSAGAASAQQPQALRSAAPSQPAAAKTTTPSWHLLLGLGVVLVVGGGCLRRRTAVVGEPGAGGATVTRLERSSATRSEDRAAIG